MTANDRLKQELIEQFGTPCAVIDLDIVDRNIAHLQSLCDATGLANRPHITGLGREFFAQVTMRDGQIVKVS